MRADDGGQPEHYNERLWVPWHWWLVPAVFLWTVWLAVAAALGSRLAFAVTVPVAVAVAATLLRYGSARITVGNGELAAGPARIPLPALGAAHALDEAAARHLRGAGADARAFLLLRGYLRTAVRVEITEAADPTPYAYLSTRHPRRLVAALTTARQQASGTGAGDG